MAAFDNLGRAAKSGLLAYRQAYLANLREVMELQADAQLLRARFACEPTSDHEDFVRFASVFNDIAFIELVTPSELSMVAFTSEGFAAHFGSPSLEVSMSATMAERLGVAGQGSAAMTPMLVFPSGTTGEQFLSNVQPLIEANRLLVVPNRALLAETGVDGNGRRNWMAHSIDETSPLDAWVMIEEEVAQNRPLPLMMTHGAPRASDRALFEVSIPYLRGVPFRDLATILMDEGDLVSALRASIKDVVSKARVDQSSREIAKDTIDPKLDLLSRRFRALTHANSLRMAGATLGSVTLAFTAVATAGIAGALATVAGAGGVGLLAKQYADYREQRSRLTEDPYYFLWRCRQVARRR